MEGVVFGIAALDHKVARYVKRKSYLGLYRMGFSFEEMSEMIGTSADHIEKVVMTRLIPARSQELKDSLARDRAGNIVIRGLCDKEREKKPVAHPLMKDRLTEVVATDDRGPGDAHHEYVIRDTTDHLREWAHVKFQAGGVSIVGVNGVHNEDLLNIVRDRLSCFQTGEFACRENALAITKIEEALHWLNQRTEERRVRGVVGTQVV